MIALSNSINSDIRVVPHLVVGLGEILWDFFADHEKRLGGAPANLVYHASVLGDHGVIAGRVGNDDLGEQAVQELQKLGLEVSYVQRDLQFPSGVAQVSFKESDPSFNIPTAAAWAYPHFSHHWEELIERAQVFCYGTLLCSQKAGREVLERAARTLPTEALRILDLNHRPPVTDIEAIEHALQFANVVKLNQEEAELLADHFSISDLASFLITNGQIKCVALTRGSRGSILKSAAFQHQHEGIDCSMNNGDSVGAGDAFTAVLAHGLVRHVALDRINVAANQYAAFVASCRGAMPKVPKDVKKKVLHILHGDHFNANKRNVQ